ncbi:Tetratricopeptide-like helical [Beauveria brongniartii RCEF 3172]|uniref:Tetratricopeptide-like helical n=1 Tax=Beauveria brongniartii RCEF 3172 TaxID=1081107 RepID=A0A167IJ75_9HYPO|nr:Tetratricopeptide-like helical [Beauveria brongniartii RCEF 3172]
MRYFTHHRGHKILLRVCTEAHRVPALSVVVEDEQEQAIVLRLENQPDEKTIPSRQYLSKGTVLLLKEPFLQVENSGRQFTLRVDHVSDLIWLHGDDERIPIAWRPRISETDSVKTRLRGNDFFNKNELGNALQHYTQAIKSAQTSVDAQIAHDNRALVNLRLGRLENAFNDAVAMKFELKPTEKGMFREATCLYKLQKFDQCLLKLQELQSRHPSNKEVLSEIKRVNTRLKECNDGIFDWLDTHKQAEHSPPLIDCATFSKSTEIRESPGLGRGLFTTKPIAAGELLLCEKAFSFNFTGEGEKRNRTLLVDPDTMSAMPDCYLQDVTQVVQKLYHEPGMAPLFLELDHGDYTAPQPGLQVDCKPVVDSHNFLVARIISTNAFTAPRSTLKHLRTVLDRELDNGKPWLTSSGIWYTSSYINHSCVANCNRTFIGDMIIIRATEDLPAGTELKLSYTAVGSQESYEQTQKKFSLWNFSCTCYLCEVKKKTRDIDIRLRKTQSQSLDALLTTPGPVDMDRAWELLRLIDKTYNNSGQLECKFTLQQGYYPLAVRLMKKCDLDEATAMMLRVLGLGGFTWAPQPAENGYQNSAMIEIRKWGPGRLVCFSAIQSLYRICKKAGAERRAPKQFAIMRAYAEIAHSLIVGEPETFAHTW